MIRRIYAVLAVIVLVLFVNAAMAAEPGLFGKVTFKILDLKKSTGFETGNLEDGFHPKFRTRVSRITVEIVNQEFTDEQKKSSPLAWKYLENNAKELDINTYLNNPDNKDLLDIYMNAIKKGLVFTSELTSTQNPLSNGEQMVLFSITKILSFPADK
ncbi:MAG: hypothetical protein HQM09_17365 [Candidatus Riflebacteria bacterium]|nr:hypothetical protein [Candidatus Riflebacteria bacterium]